MQELKTFFSYQAVEFSPPGMLLQKSHSKFKAMYDAMKSSPRGESINEEEEPAKRDSMGCDDAISWWMSNQIKCMTILFHNECRTRLIMVNDATFWCQTKTRSACNISWWSKNKSILGNDAVLINRIYIHLDLMSAFVYYLYN